MLMNTSPLAMLSLEDDPVIQLLSAHAFVGRTYGFKEEWLCKKTYQHKKLRIGYLSGDLCTHAVGLLMADFLENHNRNKFELFAFDFSPEDGTTYRERLKSTFDHFLKIGQLTDLQAASLILENEIDVLVDMHGLSSGARPGICAMHPAPLQGTYLGFIGTTAMPWLDFVVADRQVLPDSLTPYFTEKPLYLDGSFLPLNKSNENIIPAKREALGLPKESFVMAAFGNVYKINEELLNSWVEILKRSNNTVLWLMDDNTYTTEQLKKKFTSLGIPEYRVVFSPRANYGEYLARLKTADLFLDSYPYNCGSTTHDVFNCGLPMVTLRGKTMVSRMGASMLDALGLNELITDNHQAYIDLVLKIAANKIYKDELSKSLVNSVQRKQINAQLLTASFERELVRMYQQKLSQNT
jgi:predicted O-linked N-acetylglucosamine transferase (SPINDLY family)